MQINLHEFHGEKTMSGADAIFAHPRLHA